jgi:hypothetical protein
VGGPEFKPHELQKKFTNKTNDQSLGSTWQPMSGPRGTTSFANLPSHVSNVDSPTCLPCQYSCHLSALYPVTCHRTVGPHGTCMSVPHVTLPVVTHVTSGWSMSIVHNLPTMMPCQFYGRTTFTISYHVALYRLYSQHCFCMFGKMNRT